MDAIERYDHARRMSDGYHFLADSLGQARRDAADIKEACVPEIEKLEQDAIASRDRWDDEAGRLKPAADKLARDRLEFANDEYERSV